MKPCLVKCSFWAKPSTGCSSVLSGWPLLGDAFLTVNSMVMGSHLYLLCCNVCLLGWCRGILAWGSLCKPCGSGAGWIPAGTKDKQPIPGIGVYSCKNESVLLPGFQDSNVDNMSPSQYWSSQGMALYLQLTTGLCSWCCQLNQPS